MINIFLYPGDPFSSLKMSQCKSSSSLITYFRIFILLTTVYLTNAFSPNDSETSDMAKCNFKYCVGNGQSSLSGLQNINCRCDDLCWRRRDCCINHFNVTYGQRQINVDVPPSILQADRLYECHTFPETVQLSKFQEYKPTPTSGYSLISKCSSLDEQISEEWQMQKTLCEQPVDIKTHDLLSIVPVSNYLTNASYKNIFCASCHNDFRHVRFWNVSAVCPANSTVANVSEAVATFNQNSKDKCELQITPPNLMKPVTCHLPVISRLNSCDEDFVQNNPEVGPKIEFLCKITYSYVLINKTTYYNPYCAACQLGKADVNEIIDQKYTSCKAKQSSFRKPFTPIGFPNSPIKSFAVLMDIDFSNSKGNIVGLTQKCPMGSIFDEISQKCRLVFCSKPYVYQFGNCVLDFLSTSTEPYANHASSYTAEGVHATKNVEHIQRCPKISLDVHEGEINVNGSLTVNRKKVYPKGSFEQTDNGTFYVCIDFRDNYAHHFSSQIHIYMTLLCTLLSVIALFVKILTFIFIPEIRNFPAKMVFCLSISLFLAQLLFLSSLAHIPYYFLCASIGILTHYFYLTSFCWMNILSYDLWRTFSTCTESRTLSSSGTINRRFHCYSMYAWLTPLTIIATSCTFDYGGFVDETSILRPFYGVTACWISTKIALLIYFALPLALLLFANFLFFGFTTVNICVNSQATALVQEKIRSQKNKSTFCGSESKFMIPKLPHHLRFSLYIKLALIMGLTWVIGFAAAYCGQPVLWYIFILLNSSQGVYILLAFTPYRKIQCWIQRQIKPKNQSLFGHGIFSGSSGYNQPSHRKLQRSSTRSSQTTTLSFNYSSQNHVKATVVLSNSGSNC